MEMSRFCIKQHEMLSVMQCNAPVSSPAACCGPSTEHLGVLTDLHPNLALTHGSYSTYSNVPVANCSIWMCFESSSLVSVMLLSCMNRPHSFRLTFKNRASHI